MVWPARKLVPDIPPPSLPSVVLMAPRVIVRPPLLGDASAWIATRSANQQMLMALEPTWPEDALSHDFFVRRMKRQARDWRDKTAYSFLIFGREDDRLMGGVNLNHVALGAARSASLGYWLDQDCHGKGYMREALAAVIHYAFDALDLHRLNAACLPGNEKSIALLRALEFEEEGFARSYYRINGVWEDHVLFGLIRKTELLPTPEQPE